MSLRRALLAALALGGLLLGLALWRGQLLTVSRPGEGPRALDARPVEARVAATVDVVLPAVPVGLRPLRGGDRVLLVHYWAPWERDASAQATALDSLLRTPGMNDLDAAIVCFDPFPSVARFVARRRLRVPVLLDGARALRATLPCPSIPYTYVLDASGRVAVEQAGRVDWLSPGTRATLEALLDEAAALRGPSAAETRDTTPAGSGPAGAESAPSGARAGMVELNGIEPSTS